MSTDGKLSPTDADPPAGPPHPVLAGGVRRLGARAGLASLALLDLLALEDITTTGALFPELGIVVVSLPALVVLWHFARESRDDGS